MFKYTRTHSCVDSSLKPTIPMRETIADNLCNSTRASVFMFCSSFSLISFDKTDSCMHARAHTHNSTIFGCCCYLCCTLHTAVLLISLLLSSFLVRVTVRCAAGEIRKKLFLLNLLSRILFSVSTFWVRIKTETDWMAPSVWNDSNWCV